MYHFFAEHENIHDSYIDIVGSDVNHIKNVLRFKEGDKLLISSGDNVDYECSIASMSDEYIRADILSKDEHYFLLAVILTHSPSWLISTISNSGFFLNASATSFSLVSIIPEVIK